MANWMFVLSIAVLLTPVYIWSFKALPKERWQIICAIPVKKRADGSWQGLNLTYYGLFNAMALSAGVALVFILAGSIGVDYGVLAAILTLLLGCCLPASRLIARWVEKKPHTFSVGAASFLGVVAGPWMVLMMASIGSRVWGIAFDTMAVMAALMVGYALGEGLGRLACISFGCCYGKPIEQMPPLMRRYLSWAAFTYSGGTKKIAYAHRLEGEKIFAVQAFTTVLYSAGALVGTILFLYGQYTWSYSICLVVTQGWRFLSEFLRSDYRGDRRISAYQIMSLVTIFYGLLLPVLLPSSGQAADVIAGLRRFWDPSMILFLQAIWIMMFLRTGRSQVTGSGLTFHVHQDCI